MSDQPHEEDIAAAVFQNIDEKYSSARSFMPPDALDILEQAARDDVHVPMADDTSVKKKASLSDAARRVLRSRATISSPRRSPSMVHSLLKAANNAGDANRSGSSLLGNLEDLFSKAELRHVRSLAEVDEEPEDVADEAKPLIPPKSSSYGSKSEASSGGGNPAQSNRPNSDGRLGVRGFLWFIVCNSYIIRFSIPFAVISWIIFYQFDNPSVEALPGQTSVSWWLNLAARQIVVLETARIWNYLLVDFLFPRTRCFKILSPFVTAITLSSKGWPGVLFVMGIFDFVLSSNKIIQSGWLEWTGLEIYSIPGDAVLKSEFSLRVVLCLIVAGGTTILKRFWVTTAFGRRQYGMFAGRLEKMMADVVILNEVASLAAGCGDIRDELSESPSAMMQRLRTDRSTQKVEWSSIKKRVKEREDDPLKDVDVTQQEKSERDYLSRSASGFSVLSLLDNWREPEIEHNKKQHISIEDILLFRRSMHFIDGSFPFGEDFGPASNRDECIRSASAVFLELCQLSSNKDNSLDFSVLDLLATNEKGERDETKSAILRRLFRPGANECLTEFMFVESCDSLYRRVKTFRASVINSASLDHVLEQVINIIYICLLVLVMLSVLELNPWGFLVSFTSILVSMSFAFGSTASKYVLGILMIAIARPYELGDRIYLAPSADIQKGVEHAVNTWIVEDITLTTSKIRYAITGETAYLTNSTLNDMRIYNYNRSSYAMIVLPMNFHISILDKDNLQQFKSAMESYVKAHPRKWVSLVAIRCLKILHDTEQVEMALAFRHRSSWEDFSAIFSHKSSLLKFIYAVSQKLNVSELSPVSRQVLFVGGSLKDGQVHPGEHRAHVLRYTNVQNVAPAPPSGGMSPDNPLVRMAQIQP